MFMVPFIREEGAEMCSKSTRHKLSEIAAVTSWLLKKAKSMDPWDPQA